MHQINQCTGVAARSQSMHDESTSIRTDESGEDTGHFSDEDGDWYGKCTFPVVGVGGIGTRIVDQLWALGLTTSLRLAIDTDRENLEEVRADRRILIGRSLSEKYEVNTLIGRMAAERSRTTIERFLEVAFGESVCDEIASRLPGMKEGHYVPVQYFIRSGPRDRIQVVAFFSGMTQVVRKSKQRADTTAFERHYTPYR